MPSDVFSMTDDQDSPNDVGENGDGHGGHEIADYDGHTTAIIVRANTTTPAVLDYEDEPIEDYVVNLVVNEQPELVPARTDLTTAIYEEFSGNTTAITGGKHEGGKFVKQKSVE